MQRRIVCRNFSRQRCMILEVMKTRSPARSPGIIILRNMSLHGKEKYQEPHWYLVAKDTKERLGSISSECKWSERPHRVSPEIRKEAEALTREFAPSLEFYFRNGIPDIGDPY